MKAALHRQFGGIEVLEVLEVPDPRPEPGDVTIRVSATALNRLDVLQRAGPALLPGFSLPHIAGLDVVGEIVDLGDAVDRRPGDGLAADGLAVGGLALGDRVVVNPAVQCRECSWCTRGDDGLCPNVKVVGGNVPGGYAELCVVPATHVHRIPDAVSYEEAVTVPTIWSTAWHGLVVVGQLRIGEWVMIHAAASGVSTAAIQLAKRMGAHVLATAGSERKLDVARKLGADVAVNNRTDNFVAVAKEVTGGDGVDMVFDHVGAALFQSSLFALRPRGRMVFCGVTAGSEATFNLPHAYHFGIQLLGVDPYPFAEFEAMLEYYWRGGFQPVIDSELPLDDVAEAHRKMDSDDVIGKIILHP